MTVKPGKKFGFQSAVHYGKKKKKMARLSWSRWL